MEAFFGGGGNPNPHHNNNNDGAGNPLLAFLRVVTGQGAGMDFARTADFATTAAADAAAYAEQAAQGIFDPQPTGPSGGPPPASAAALRQLPTVTVTAEDLVEPSNRECCICFDEHNINDKVVRLPCAHIYHAECITEWLEKHCTCPTCRYELPTADPQYEAGRRERMRTRKPRYAKYELERMSVRELKSLLPRRTSTRQFTDKTDLVDYIISNDIVDLINTPPPVEFPNLACLRAMGVGELKRTMNDNGVYFDPKDVVEKEDMVQIFVNSGRICLAEEEDPQAESTNYSTSYGHESRSNSIDETNAETSDNNQTTTTTSATTEDTTTATATTNTTTSSSSGGIVVETVGTLEEDDSSDSRSYSPTQSNSPLSGRNWDSGRVMEETNFGSRDAAAAAAAAATSANTNNNSSTTTTTTTTNASATATTNTPIDTTTSTASSTLERCDKTYADETDNQEMVMEETASSIEPEQSASGAATGPAEGTSEPPTDRSIHDTDAAMQETGAAVAANSGGGQSASDETMEPSATASASLSPELNDDGDDMDDPETRRKRRRRQESLVGSDEMDGTCQFQNLSIHELRTIAREQGVDLSNCIERGEMIERLSSASSAGIEGNNSDNASTTASEPRSDNASSSSTATGQLSPDTFQGWSVSQLRACAHTVDVDFSHCTDQAQMIDCLLIAASERPHVANYLSSLSPLMGMSTSQLRALAREWQVGVSDCLEKGEIIGRLAVSAVDRR